MVEEPEPIRYGRFTKLWVGYPRAVMLMCFLLICGFSYLSFLKKFKEPVNTGWTNRAHHITQRLDAWFNIDKDWYEVSASCLDVCEHADDGDCDDGGPGSEFSQCPLGTDCTDCGARAGPRPEAIFERIRRELGGRRLSRVERIFSSAGSPAALRGLAGFERSPGRE